MGKVYARKGRIQEARSVLKELSRRVGDPQAVSGVSRSNRGDQAAYLYLKGEIELAQNRFEEAIASFESAGKTEDASPDEPLARAYHLSGRLDEAIAKYRAYLSSNQPDEESWVLARYHLARIYEQKGMREMAAESYKEFLDMWKEGDGDLPPLVDAKRRLANLTSGGAR